MLSRRHLRVKALQALYSYYQSEHHDLIKGEKQLVTATDKLFELYVWQLSLIVELSWFVRHRLEEAKKKFFPTEEDLSPNTRFVENPVIRQLENNKDIQRRISKYKISWADESNLLLRLFNDLKTKEEYQEYMKADKVSYNDHKTILKFIMGDLLWDFEWLRNYYEDKSIFWGDGDYEIALGMALKLVAGYRKEWGEEHPLPSLFKENGDEGEEEDRKFMLELFRKTIIHGEDFETLIENKAQNWELERIAIMDIIILKMALAELTLFSSIPVKVTLNEYIEIAKTFSSAKSRIFVNGILDKLIKELADEGRIVKTGRGLLDH